MWTPWGMRGPTRERRSVVGSPLLHEEAITSSIQDINESTGLDRGLGKRGRVRERARGGGKGRWEEKLKGARDDGKKCEGMRRGRARGKEGGGRKGEGEEKKISDKI